MFKTMSDSVILAQELIVDTFIRYPNIVIIGFFGGLFILHCIYLRQCIDKNAEYHKVGAKVWDIHDNKRNAYIHALYACMFFGLALMLLAATIAAKIK